MEARSIQLSLRVLGRRCADLGDGAAAALQEGGFEVAVARLDSTRSAGPEVVDMVVQILEVAEEHVIEAAVGVAAASLVRLAGRLRREKRRVRVAILGPRGETLRIVELPEEPDEDQPGA
jgi:hypothetical protein